MSRFVREVEVAVGRREAACVVDVAEKVSDCCRFREESLQGVCCRAKSELHAGAGGAVGGAIEDVVCYGLARVAALWA